MKIKTREKIVREFTIKLSEAELRGIHNDLFDVLNATDMSLPDLYSFYDNLRALVHNLP